MTSPSSPRRHDTGTGQLLAEVAGAVAVVTFNNPAKRNALSREMRAALPGAARRAAGDPDVRVVVLHRRRGQGVRLRRRHLRVRRSSAPRPPPGPSTTGPGRRIDRAWESLDKPVIAMIRGFCMGGGLLTALQADIRIAADDSQFGVPAARLGLGYGFGGVTALTEPGRPGLDRRDPVLRAALHRGRGAADGPGQPRRPGRPACEAEVMSLARRIAQNAPLTVAAAKAAIREAGRPPDRAGPGPGPGDGRGLLPVRRLPRGPARVRREAPARVHRPVTPGRDCASDPSARTSARDGQDPRDTA